MSESTVAERVIELVEEALAHEPAERAAFLAQACAGNGALRLEVESLLGFQQRAQGFLETPAFALDVAAIPDAAGVIGGELPAGETLGDCKILSLLGEGGMGEVYLARDTVLGRQVAVKLLHRGFGGDTTLRRFQHERRVLAGLNHPHIARLYGGAVLLDGRPYLVMEYVEGERLDHYCNRHQLPVPARLALFRKVCSAVAYAHQNLVIHRDLKPGNILVTADGEPKLLDFGIAKLLDPDATGQPEATLTFAAAMTPGYASPEQLRGDPISTASDTYSLGVVLYELLTGQRPHAATGRPAKDLARAALDDTATTERPSAAVARAATAADGKLPVCGENPERLRRRLRGDLDNIVLMAMRREPARRYVSVSQFSADIGRHCDGQPVVARKDTLGYRAGKFVRRNRVGVAAAVLLFLSLVAGVVATARQAARADRRFNDVRRLANSILFEVDPLMANVPGSITARTALVRRALEYLDSLSREADGDRDLNRELATAYEKVGDVQGNPAEANVGDIKGALASYDKARNLRQALLKAAPKDGRLRHELANNYEQTGYILWWMNDTERADATYQSALTLRKALLAEQPHSVDYRKGMASLEMKMGDVLAWNNDGRGALPVFNAALSLLQGLATEQPTSTDAQIAVARCLRRVGEAYKLLDEMAKALAASSQAQAIVEPIANADPNAFEAQSELWFILFKRCEMFLEVQSFKEALPLFPQVVSLAEGLVRRDPKNVNVRHKLASSEEYFAVACLEADRNEEAVQHFGEALKIDTELVNTVGTATFRHSCANHQMGIGKGQLRLGQLDEAMANQQAASAELERELTIDPRDLMVVRDLADAYHETGRVQAARGKPVEAREAFNRSIKNWEALSAASPLDKGDTKTLAEIRTELAAVR